eukprot:6482033-Pyramimonas_sp.AAC.1
MDPDLKGARVIRIQASKVLRAKVPQGESSALSDGWKLRLSPAIGAAENGEKGFSAGVGIAVKHRAGVGSVAGPCEHPPNPQSSIAWVNGGV